MSEILYEYGEQIIAVSGAVLFIGVFKYLCENDIGALYSLFADICRVCL
ncbi:MAG: hypothetical protein K6E13_10655 [Lachnospiraceae bacterium]|nr:hypothetical protein [Lachnospiraceae bacterium]